MKRAPLETPRLLLGTESLLGFTRAPRDRLLQVTARFAEPESLAVTFSKAIQLGADGVLASPSRVLRDALSELGHTVPVFALLPNVPEYVRDSSEHGLAGTALKRVAGAGFGARVRLGWTGVTHLRGVLRSDFAALVPLLLELESARFRAAELRGIVLAAPITDLALAGRHRAFFEQTVRFVRRRFGALAAFQTHNLGHLLAALGEWEVMPDFVVGPVNPRGLMMKPTPEVVEAELARTRVPVLAKELRAGGAVSLLEGASHALRHGAKGLVPDLVDVEDLAAEFKELGRTLTTP
ncbi:MAG: hypothetical protein E6K80_01795 [Candidatus Eisenbacteria bacterium]|uniref:Uroporphyrinogen decarboxylase (URO-D) domain-containing protein n=1 Tax=Eiseniibacteriota bacterium TaxID=2212470 RepID=A0A538UAA3_UNCEI|nr:MAG: hypothetical protein E6K80_01795 [Candidatus Eisenbacteria bacterium]